MSEQEQTAQQAWQALETFWSPFSFLFAPGSTPAQIDVWQKKEGVTLPPDVRALIGVHGSVGLPGGVYTDFSAEVTLSTLDQWTRFDRSVLNNEAEVEPDFWPSVFKNYNCPSTSMKDYVVIGVDPSGVDYGIYAILHLESSAVFGITVNTAKIQAFGTMTAWLAERRLGRLENVTAYPTRWNGEVDEDDFGGAGLARFYRSKLDYFPKRLARWETVEAKFIQTFDALNPG